MPGTGDPADTPDYLDPIDYESLNLQVVNLPAGRIHGFDVAFDLGGGPPGFHTQYDPKAAGFDGIHFIGQGRGVTTIISPDPDRAGQGETNISVAIITVYCGQNAGVVVLESLTIETEHGFGSGRAIQIGRPDTQATATDLACVLRDVKVQAPTKGWPGYTIPGTNPPVVVTAVPYWGKWSLFSYNADWDLMDCEIDSIQTAEHALYAHGYALNGVRWERVTMIGSGAENLKLTQRPWEDAWTPQARVLVKECSFRNWWQDWSFQGGAGMTNQGAGWQWCRVECCEFHAPESVQGKDKGKCLTIDDSGTTNKGADFPRYYNLQGVLGGTGPCNGDLEIISCGFHVQNVIPGSPCPPYCANDDGPIWCGSTGWTGSGEPFRGWPPQFPSINGNLPHNLLRSIKIRNSAFYDGNKDGPAGPGTGIGGSLSFRGLAGQGLQAPYTDDAIQQTYSHSGNNTESIATYAQNLGWNTSSEPNLRIETVTRPNPSVTYQWP